MLGGVGGALGSTLVRYCGRKACEWNRSLGISQFRSSVTYIEERIAHPDRRPHEPKQTCVDAEPSVLKDRFDTLRGKLFGLSSDDFHIRQLRVWRLLWTTADFIQDILREPGLRTVVICQGVHDRHGFPLAASAEKELW